MSYLDEISTRKTPQDRAIPGREAAMVENRAGGYVFPVDDWTRLERFLILGTEGGTYYASQREMTRENAEVVFRCVEKDGVATVNIILEISASGRAPHNTEALFALAIASTKGDGDTRRHALQNLSAVARTSTHLFQFLNFREQFGGWGRGHKREVQNWYLNRPIDKLAYQMVKYRQREGWTHADVLRLAKPMPERGSDYAELFAWVTETGDQHDHVVPAIVEGFALAQRADTTPQYTAELIREYELPREAVKTEHLNEPVVQNALLDGMPITALIRNLAGMTMSGLLKPTSEATKHVIRELGDKERLTRGRVHPVAVLLALKTYASGRGLRGRGEWQPVPQIIDALDAAFYDAFANVEPTGKRLLLALDVSSSMHRPVLGVPDLSAAQAVAAIALMFAKTEAAYECVAFTGGGYGLGWRNQGQSADMVSAFPLSPRQRLDDVLHATDAINFGSTDCALPMLYAMEHEREIDAFVILTDNESWVGGIHANQALAEYRRHSGIAAKMVAMATTATSYSVADPDDAGMLDVVGFDAAAPQVVSDFLR